MEVMPWGESDVVPERDRDALVPVTDSETEPDEKERILHSWQDKPNRLHLELAKEASQETTSNVSWREGP